MKTDPTTPVSCSLACCEDPTCNGTVGTWPRAIYTPPCGSSHWSHSSWKTWSSASCLCSITGWIRYPWFGTTVTGATEALNTVEALTTAFIVFTFGSLLIVVQVASGQLTPRLIATTLLRNNVIKFTVGLFTFTMMFAVGTAARFDTEVPRFAVTIAWVLGIASIAAFFFLIDYTARSLRPVSIVGRIAEDGIKVVESVYPEMTRTKQIVPTPVSVDTNARAVNHLGRSAIVLAVNLKSLVGIAQRAGGLVELVPRVGDFVATGDPLFRLHGSAARIDDSKLRAQVAFGPERTIEQDSTFAIRVIVDIAIKALSPAINDPTTAVLAIDQLHRLIRLVGARHLHDDVLHNSAGVPRLIFHTPNWEDFATLTFSEIRLYGAGNFQIARRLQAMLKNLRKSYRSLVNMHYRVNWNCSIGRLKDITRSPKI